MLPEAHVSQDCGGHLMSFLAIETIHYPSTSSSLLLIQVYIFGGTSQL